MQQEHGDMMNVCMLLVKFVGWFYCGSCVNVRLIDCVDVLLMKESQKQEEVKQILILTDRSYNLQRLDGGSLRK